jgi:predicted nucleotidyltransferase
MALARELQPVAEALRLWASNEPDLRRVWIYGSQVRGRPSPDSDLDVAVEVIPRDGENTYDVFVCSADDWRSELTSRVAPHKLDLKLYDASKAREKVRRGVEEDGVLVYERAT